MTKERAQKHMTSGRHSVPQPVPDPPSGKPPADRTQISVARIGAVSVIVAAVIGAAATVAVTLLPNRDSAGTAPAHSASVAVSPSAHDQSTEPSAAYAPSDPTFNQVRASLITASDLDSLDANLSSVDIQRTQPGACHAQKAVRYKILSTRRFTDIKNDLNSFNGTMVFSSPEVARTALDAVSDNAKCTLEGPYSISDISSQLDGLCNQRQAWKAKVKNKLNAFTSVYFGVVRCGRVLASFEVITYEGSPFDRPFSLVDGMEIAASKVERLLNKNVQ